MGAKIDADHVNEFELETWSRCAQDYLSGFAGMTRGAYPFLAEAVDLAAGSKVLDVGSGPGHICGMMSELGCEPTGIDFSASMVRVAKEHYPDIDFHQGNAEELPFDDGQFDAAISSFTVHHLARPQRVFSEISRVLKQNARFAYSVFAHPESQSSIGAFFAAVEKHHSLDDLPHGPLFGVTDPDVHGDMLAAGGLKDAKFEFRDFMWREDSPMPVWESFRNWGNIDALPEEIGEAIRKSTLENLEGFKTDAGYEFPHTVLVVSAVNG